MKRLFGSLIIQRIGILHSLVDNQDKKGQLRKIGSLSVFLNADF
jgi:hypothetical protein